ncbi:MAG: xylulokinase [Actinomycetota bacterium]
MTLVAGVDSSTQSTKVEIRRLDDGEVVARGSAPHPAVSPPVSEADPADWWTAFESAWAQATDGSGDVDGDPVGAISVGGQQHGMVALDVDDRPIHPAKLWNDTESAADADWLIGQLGGPDAWADAVGTVPVAAITITKLSWLHRQHPDRFARISRVLLPHDEITRRLTGRYVTDRGDVSGTGYWSPATGEYRWDLLEIVDDAVDWPSVVPEVLGPTDVAGEWNGITVGPGTGDNMGAALGVGLRPGDAVISVGTSGTVFAVADAPTADPSGFVAGFADASGRYLPLVCTSNASRVLDAVRRLLGVDHEEFDELAIAAAPGGPVLLPYLDGERTPNRPDATGVLGGLRTDVTREQLARAAVDGVVCGLLDGLDALQRRARVDGRLLLVGGGARSVAIQRSLASLVDLPVVRVLADEAVATGAAVQAAAVAGGEDVDDVIRRWGLGAGESVRPIVGVDAADVRSRYAELRDRT